MRPPQEHSLFSQGFICFSYSNIPMLKFSQQSNLATQQLNRSNSKPKPVPMRSRLEIVVEAPKMINTAASVPCLRVNDGLVKPGDVGRVVSRKPKDVWAVRLSIGTYLLDGKYFKALEFDERGRIAGKEALYICV